MKWLILILCLLMATPCYGDTKELLKDGITGAGAGAVGSAIGKDNMLGAAAAGAGVNIVGGAILDTILDDKPKTTTREVVVEKEVVVERPVVREVVVEREVRRDRGRKLGHYKKRHKCPDNYPEGFSDGYTQALKDVIKYCEGKL